MRRRAAALAHITTWVCAGWLALSCERDQTPLGRGGRIFQRSCAQCHGADGRGIQRLGLLKPPRDLTQPEFHAHITDPQLREVIRYGKGQMPAFGGLMADEDIGHVITFIRTLAPRAPASAPAPAGSPPAGESGTQHAPSSGASGAFAVPSVDQREARSR